MCNHHLYYHIAQLSFPDPNIRALYLPIFLLKLSPTLFQNPYLLKPGLGQFFVEEEKFPNYSWKALRWKEKVGGLNWGSLRKVGNSWGGNYCGGLGTPFFQNSFKAR